MASTYQESVEQTITAGEQIHQIVNGTATTEVTVEDGSKVPSIRKALLDNFYFKDPIAWQVGQTENVFNQLRQFTDGSWWYAPSATAINPVSMGSTPVGDVLWKIYDFDAIGKLTPQIRESLRRSYAEAGYNLVDGSFEAGGTLVNANDALLHEATGRAYSGPAGVVAPNTDPLSDPLYVAVDSATLADRLAAPDSDVLVGGVDAGDLAKSLKSTIQYNGYQEMITNAAGLIVEAGQRVRTGAGTWVITQSVSNNVIVNTSPQLYAQPLNGAWIDDFGGKGDALFRDNATGNWYQDSGFTIPATDSTAAFQAAIQATGGIDGRGTIVFGDGGYFIAPEAIDANGIDIRQKTLRGMGPERTTLCQSGNNTYQTFFRNNPRNLSEAGGWGSGGSFKIFNLYIRGNWDGTSGQTVIPPVSGNGNGLTGILKADYDFDAQGGLIQLISPTRFAFDNVWLSHGYGHNYKFFRGGYGDIRNGRSFATRGSGCWIHSLTPADSFTSSPIDNIKFEVCRGGYGALYVNNMFGSSINNCLFEGNPYGIYITDSGDVDTSGNYIELSYIEDFYIDPSCWGVVDIGNYSFNLGPIRNKSYKGLFHYRRDTGLHVDTDNPTYGTRPASINNFYMQRDTLGHGKRLPPLGGSGGVSFEYVKNLNQAGGVSVGWYTAMRHAATVDTDAGAAEVRYRRNTNQNTRSALSFATYDGATLADRWWIEHGGNLRPNADNTVSVGSAAFRPNQIFAATGTINTSDERDKTELIAISDLEKLVAMEIKESIRKFKFNDAVTVKGESARIHFGVGAQTVKAIFEKHGLDPFSYALLCYDEWDERPEVKDENGVVVQEYSPAGSRYGIRYDELAIFILAAI